MIELNPFITSNAGHLFQEDYSDRWAAWDALPDDPVDFRLREFTETDVLKWVPDSWQSYLRSSSDVYGPDV